MAIGIAEISVGESRSEPQSHGPGLRRYLLLTPARSGDTGGGNDGRAGIGGPLRKSSLHRDIELQPRTNNQGGKHATRVEDTVPDSPDQVLRLSEDA